jgi:hypothetical protein
VCHLARYISQRPRLTIHPITRFQSFDMRMHRGLIDSSRLDPDLGNKGQGIDLSEQLSDLSHTRPYLREILKLKANRGLSLTERIYFMQAKLRQLQEQRQQLV